MTGLAFEIAQLRHGHFRAVNLHRTIPRSFEEEPAIWVLGFFLGVVRKRVNPTANVFAVRVFLNLLQVSLSFFVIKNASKSQFDSWFVGIENWIQINDQRRLTFWASRDSNNYGIV